MRHVLIKKLFLISFLLIIFGARIGFCKTEDIGGIKLNYYENDLETDVTLLFIHGYGANLGVWRYVLSYFDERFHVVALDLKGFGKSSKPRDDEYSLASQAEIVVRFIKQKKLKNVVLVGNSMGGGVALLTYFELGSDWIRALVLVDSVGFPQPTPFFIKYLRIPIIGGLITKLLPSKFMVKRVLRLCYFDKEKVTKELIELYAAPLKEKNAKYVLIQTARQIVPENMTDLIQQYKDITVPVLIIWGAEDEVIPLKNAYLFNNAINNSELKIIPSCGHMPQEEKPDYFNRLLQDFLANHF